MLDLEIWDIWDGPVPPTYHFGAFELRPTPWAEQCMAVLTLKTLGDRHPNLEAYCATCKKTLANTDDVEGLGFQGYGIVRRICGIASDHSRSRLNHAVFIFYNNRLIGQSPYSPLATCWP